MGKGWFYALAAQKQESRCKGTGLSELPGDQSPV